MARSLITRFVSVSALVGLTATSTIALPSAASACGGCAAAHAAGQQLMMMGAMTVGAIAVGAIAASNGGLAYGACHIERHRAYDEDGNVFTHRVRVCE